MQYYYNSLTDSMAATVAASVVQSRQSLCTIQMYSIVLYCTILICYYH